MSPLDMTRRLLRLSDKLKKMTSEEFKSRIEAENRKALCDFDLDIQSDFLKDMKQYDFLENICAIKPNQYK
jgi:hypothetical protein